MLITKTNNKLSYKLKQYLMDEIKKEKIRLTTKEILLMFCDGLKKIEEIFGYSWQRYEAKKYFFERNIDKDYYYRKMWELEKRGYIKRFAENRKNILELTSIGKDKALKYFLNDKKIDIPKHWDKKWRLVIFDVPKNKKNIRDIIRNRLKNIGFYQLQKSVFIFPYDCLEHIKALKYLYSVGPYLQYIVAENIETEINLVDYFYNAGIINKKS